MKNIIPDKLSIKRKRNKVVYSYDRFQYSSLIGIFISLLFLITLLSDLIDFRISENPIWLIPGLLIPGYILYTSIHYSFNSINIVIDVWYVIVYPSPIPTRWRKKIRTQNIRNVFTKSILVPSSDSSSEYYTYTVCFVLDDGKEVPILDRIGDSVHAKAIQGLLKEELNLDSGRVFGSV
ncbi:hypothetical protein [Leptospira adleri]|uniref:Uncharacterized protein n=1 Tax=Leptospira adleri TaxID=2023186 RepID=A0A2M9YQN4_9LEPT|nr:hypothetical protein [Leptospira adleri]PJZ53829.1 hypothetical protein CH380_07385 [Leptospira adleri]PJZ63153.1 hypothetical protein CH376_04740 [Leptospira adleri]